MIQFDNAVKKFGEVILDELYGQKITCWIAGGAVRDFFSGKPLKTDFDLFFPNQKEYDKTRKYFLDKGAEVKWESDNGMKITYQKKTFDLVKHFFDSPKETINAFDFTVSMFAVDGKQVYHDVTSFIDLSKRQLMINKITYPASTLSRAFRYQKKGFSLCLGEMAKIVKAIQEMPKQENREEDDSEENESEKSSGDKFEMFLGID